MLLHIPNFFAGTGAFQDSIVSAILVNDQICIKHPFDEDSSGTFRKTTEAEQGGAVDSIVGKVLYFSFVWEALDIAGPLPNSPTSMKSNGNSRIECCHQYPQ